MKRLIPVLLAIALCAASSVVHAATQQMESGTVITRDNVRIAYERHAERIIEFHEEAMRTLTTGWFSRTLRRPAGKAGNDL